MGEAKRQPVRNGRMFRFSLRTLLALVTVFGCWLGYSLHWIKQRKEFLDEEFGRQFVDAATGEPILVISGSYSVPPWESPAPPMLRLFGEDGHGYLNLQVAAANHEQLTVEDRQRRARAQALFPEASVDFVYLGVFGDVAAGDWTREGFEKLFARWEAARNRSQEAHSAARSTGLRPSE